MKHSRLIKYLPELTCFTQKHLFQIDVQDKNTFAPGKVLIINAPPLILPPFPPRHKPFSTICFCCAGMRECENMHGEVFLETFSLETIHFHTKHKYVYSRESNFRIRE